MLELHGWITVRETYKASFEEEDNVDAIIEEIRREIDSLSWFKPQIKALNGHWFLEFTLFSNRRNPQTQEVFGFIRGLGNWRKAVTG